MSIIFFDICIIESNGSVVQDVASGTVPKVLCRLNETTRNHRSLNTRKIWFARQHLKQGVPKGNRPITIYDEIGACRNPNLLEQNVTTEH